MKEQKKITLANMQQWVEDWVHNCEQNHKDPSEAVKEKRARRFFVLLSLFIYTLRRSSE